MRRYEIPVVWGIDKKYVLQAFVVMRSILLHSKEKYHFFVITSDSIKEETEELEKILRHEFDNFELSVKKIDDTFLTKAKIYNLHLSKAAYFRLFIPEVIQKYDKCIYLDCDLIIHGDLKELYETELEDYYLAGVKDCHIIAAAGTTRQEDHQRATGIPAYDRYVNSGVLVMGLKKMRHDRIAACFMEQIKKENWYEDQDILNVCCYPYIKMLPLKYNLFHFYLGSGIRHLYRMPYSRQDFCFDHDHPYILHMGGKYKGWNDFRIKGSRDWWQTADVFSGTQSYQFYWKECCDAAKGNPFAELIRRAKESRHIVIWGYSENGKHLLDALLEYQIDTVSAFVDTDSSFLGECYHSIPVMGFDAAWREDQDILWIISCQVSYAQVIGQLRDEGIDEENIFRYLDIFADPQYLRSLDESAYDSLISDIADREYVLRIPDKEKREQYIRNIMNGHSQCSEDYAYLAKKYNFEYWVGA